MLRSFVGCHRPGDCPSAPFLPHQGQPFAPLSLQSAAWTSQNHERAVRAQPHWLCGQHQRAPAAPGRPQRPHLGALGPSQAQCGRPSARRGWHAGPAVQVGGSGGSSRAVLPVPPVPPARRCCRYCDELTPPPCCRGFWESIPFFSSRNAAYEQLQMEVRCLVAASLAALCM